MFAFNEDSYKMYTSMAYIYIKYKYDYIIVMLVLDRWHYKL